MQIQPPPGGLSTQFHMMGRRPSIEFFQQITMKEFSNWSKHQPQIEKIIKIIPPDIKMEALRNSIASFYESDLALRYDQIVFLAQDPEITPELRREAVYSLLCIKKVNHADVENLLELGVNLHEDHPLTSIFLLRAALRGNMALLNKLIEKGVNPNQVDEDGNNALMQYVEHGDHELGTVKFLVSQVDLSAVNFSGRNVLMQAVEKGGNNANHIVKCILQQARCTGKLHSVVFNVLKEKVEEKEVEMGVKGLTQKILDAIEKKIQSGKNTFNSVALKAEREMYLDILSELEKVEHEIKFQFVSMTNSEGKNE